MSLIIGIDPGLEGALAFIDTSGNGMLAACVEDMPVAGGHVDPAVLAHLLAEKRNAHAFIEQVNSFGMGRKSAFTFGHGVGAVLGVLAALGIPYTEVTPAAWKKTYGLRRDKNASRAAALKLFPSLAGDLRRAKDDGRAEALLIAEYGRRISQRA